MMRLLRVGAAVLVVVASCVTAAQPSLAAGVPSHAGTARIAGCPLFPPNNPWRRDISVAVQDMTDLVGIFFVDARERKLGEPFCSLNVKLGGCDSALSTHQVSSEEQENDAYGKFH